MKTQLVCAVATLGVVAGCGISEPKDLRTFSFEVRELSNDSLQFDMPIELVVRTEEQVPCLRYALQGAVGFGVDVVAVELTTTNLPNDVCIPSTGPAVFRYPIGFGPVRIDNPFFLTFERGGQVDRYLVIVSQTAIDIAPLRSNFTQPTARHVPRGS